MLRLLNVFLKQRAVSCSLVMNGTVNFHPSASLALKARSWVSPVFLNAAHGRITRGLPVVDANVPLLLVGNHQLLLDCSFLP